MNIVASIEARMKSSRLPGKVLTQVCEKTILEHIIDRARQSKKINDIVVATTTSPEDEAIVDLCKKINVKYFRGSENDVLDRVTQAHQNSNTDIVVQLTGDSPFLDWDTIDKSIELFISSNVDYVSNTLVRTYPIGIRSQVYSLDLLRSVNSLRLSDRDREYVTTHICRNDTGKYSLKNLEAPKHLSYPKMRLTLDYPEDLLVVKEVYKSLFLKDNQFSLSDVVEFILKNKNIAKINENCVHVYKEGA